MAQIGNIPEILSVKRELEELTEKGRIQAWELPYENILTRLSAAIFFISPTQDSVLDEIWKALGNDETFHYRKNEEQALSKLAWRVEFNKGISL